MADKTLLDLATFMYVGEPCQICGKALTREDVADAIYVGYSKDNKSRLAHKECFEDDSWTAVLKALAALYELWATAGVTADNGLMSDEGTDALELLMTAYDTWLG